MSDKTSNDTDEGLIVLQPSSSVNPFSAGVRTVTEEPKPRVSLAVFVKLSGLQPTAYAGFLQWARARKLKHETVSGWWKLYEEHQSRPVR